MGWKAAALLVEDKTVEDIVREIDVLAPSSQEVDMVTAWYENAVAQIGRWAVFFSGGRRHPDLAKTLSRGTRAFAFDLNSVMTSYGFDYWVDGDCVRSFHTTEGSIVRNDGAPLDAEASTPIPTWNHDDDWVLTVMSKTIGVSGEDLDATRYVVLEP